MTARLSWQIITLNELEKLGYEDIKSNDRGKTRRKYCPGFIDNEN